jgi:molecular chaperone GrpE
MEDKSSDPKRQENTLQDTEESLETKVSPEQPRKKKRKSTVEDLKKRLEDQKHLAQDNYEKFLRAYADLENYKKRVERERADTLKYGNEELMRDLLPFMDNLERAIEHASSEINNNPRALIEGVQLTLKDLRTALEKHGLKAIESVGKPFDPSLHEAMMQVESEAHDPQIVVEEFQKGYLIRDRLLRPARVSVAATREVSEEAETGEEEG